MDTLRQSLETASDRGQSTIHSFEDGVNKMQDMSVANDREHDRALYLNLLVLRQVMRTYATEIFRQKAIEDLRQVENSDDMDVSPSAIAGMYSLIDEATFYDLVSKRNRETVDMDYLMEIASEVGGLSQKELNVFIKICEGALIETDNQVNDKLSNLLGDVDSILSENPTTEEWHEVYVRFNDLFGELDSSVRYPGDLS